MKARRVEGLDPAAPLRDNAARIVRAGLEEICSLAEPALDPAAATAQHDLRIAAKRLRYVLELTAPCFGERAQQGAKAAKRLQSLLGDIHDCDEMLPRVAAHEERLRTEDAAAVRAAAGEGADDLRPAATRAALHGTKYRGLEALRAYLSARRSVLYASFVAEWSKLRREGFREHLAEEVRDAASAVAA